MTSYFATVLPGLEPVLMDEIRAKLPDARLQGEERGKIYFASRSSLERLMELRTADNLYRPLRRFRVGPRKADLLGIERELSALDFGWTAGRGRAHAGTVRFKVNASRMGKHSYSRFDAAAAAERGLETRHTRWRSDPSGGHELEFRLDLIDDQAVFALRMTGASYRYRSAQRAFAPAALRPTVAHALVWLSRPDAADTFVDPCCGSGTILSERLAYPYARIVGGDRSGEAVAAARANLEPCERVRLRTWDARRLPLDAGSVDKMAANLPFGRQIAADEPLSDLYFGMLREAGRVLAGSGTFLCLTDAEAALLEAAERAGLSCAKGMTLSLKGLHPSIFTLRR
ncbi:methyltransferase domain-containing protein [Cohnella zeiphila]|uniref:Methyltransferase domain-containing protein n=1 Tax=Cohnella zeiphila TaxID=2761120 RepID=A0A7X0SN80_9BACL|nr:methyltransferase domain-containing protein [Cohnella zeiphila]MBB6733021.1 methyltransferase domain-containing protein [Cohnella zeiphila]